MIRAPDRTPRVAFLTIEDRSAFVDDDALAIEALAARGCVVEEIPWRRDAPWSEFACAVVRTTWDYQHHLDTFLAALERIAARTRMWNPFDIVRWNVRKTYLGELAERGVRVVPTAFGRGAPLAAIAPGPEVRVLKPVVGAGAGDTFVLDGSHERAELERIAARFADREWMLQPFVRSVLTEGEHSLTFFAGRFSHAVVKRPKAGDFRVQEEHGGEITLEQPAADLRAAADTVLAAVGRRLLQARVDLVRLDDGIPALMEVELVEPSLYLRKDPAAPARFADALVDLCGWGDPLERA